MKNYLRTIDVARLAGMGTVIGIDLTDECARLVVLKRHGTMIDKFKSSYRVEVFGTVTFGQGDASSEAKAEAIHAWLASNNIRTKSAVSSLRGLGMKFVSATVPASVTNIEEWITEHYERLLRLPLPLTEVSFQYEVVDSSDAENVVEIAFVRNSEVEAHMAFLKTAGLEPIAIGAGVRDLLNVVLVTEPAKEVCILHKERAGIAAVHWKDGRRKSLFTLPAGDVAEALSAQGIDPNSVVSTSEVYAGIRMLKPFGLDPEYALAAGLALKGLLPEVSPVNFLSAPEKERIAVKRDRMLAKRLTIALCSLLLVLLAGQMSAAYYIQSRINDLDEELASSGSAYSELSSLEQGIASLERKVASQGNSEGSGFARIMHKLAEVTPQDVSLTKLSISAPKDSAHIGLSASGIGRSSDAVASFLRQLKSSHLCTSVRLIRSGAPSQGNEFAKVSEASSGLVTFDLDAELR